MITQISRKFGPSFQSNLLGKLHNFRRRSVWRYALVSGLAGAGRVLLGADKPSPAGSFGLTALVVFAGLCALSGLAMVGSAWAQRASGFRGEVTFRANDLLVRPDDPGQPAAEQSWACVVSWQESTTDFYLLVRPFPRLYLLLPKRSLSREEATTLREWLRRSRPGAGAAA